jgi:hypothetical protein
VGAHAGSLLRRGGVLVLALQDELAELRPLAKRFALARVDVEREVVARKTADVETFNELAGVEWPVVHLVLRNHPPLLGIL